MPLEPRLLEILACPACHASVSETGPGLACGGCGRVYPIRDGIPVMLVEEATPPRSEGDSAGSPGT